MTREVPEANDPDLSVPNVKRRMMQQDASTPFHRLRNPNESKDSRFEILTRRIQSPTSKVGEKEELIHAQRYSTILCSTALQAEDSVVKVQHAWTETMRLAVRAPCPGGLFSLATIFRPEKGESVKHHSKW